MFGPFSKRSKKILLSLKKHGSKERNDPRQSTVFTRRALVVMAVQTAIMAALGKRLYDLQIVKGGQYALLARNNTISKRFLPPPRGLIKDRHGIILAGNQVNWRALFLPEDTTDVNGTLNYFASIIPLGARDWQRIFNDIKRNRRYVPIILRDFLSWDEMAKIELNAPSLPGVLIDAGTTRSYPFGDLFAHVVGYVATPNEKDVAKASVLALPGMRVGKGGLEKIQENYLRGQSGSVEMEVDAHGRILSQLNRQEGIRGDDVVLTIDAKLQQTIQEKIRGQSASVVVMDCNTGDVLAMVSNPSFDPALFDSGITIAQWRSWMDDKFTPLVNKAVAGIYPPGSTFKPAVLLSALESGSMKVNDRIFCPGHLDLGGTRFHCWNRRGHGSLNGYQALKYSCDVFFYEVARRTGMNAISQYSQRLGLGVTPPIELPHVKEGLIPTPTWRQSMGHKWNMGDTIVSGIGQGFVLVTPLQLAIYTARLASGRAVEPHLISAVKGDFLPYKNTESWPKLSLQDEYLSLVREGMNAVVNEPHGTASLARLSLPGFALAGKTGTSQVKRVSRAMRESGRFSSASLPWEYRPHALFIAFAPYNSPRYALSVVVEHGNAAALVAAPLARDIMTEVLSKDVRL